MKTAGIICEYNPIHKGHVTHISETRRLLGADTAIVCVMSGNFVQRGDFAVFAKHARAEAAVRCGADLVLELQTPYALSSAEGFTRGGIYILDRLGICDYLSFGSESGDIDELRAAAAALTAPQADTIIKEHLGKGLSYAAANQKAADALLGPEKASIIKSPNNLLAIEYLKAIDFTNSSLIPITVKRLGTAHDCVSGCSASALRKILSIGGEPWSFVPSDAVRIFRGEIAGGRGPVTMKSCESAILSRLRMTCLRESNNLSLLPGAADGLYQRFDKHAQTEPTIDGLLERVKTKRYAMSRVRRFLMCAALGITAADAAEPPPYARILAMNKTGMSLLKSARKTSRLPILTKPASVHRLSGNAVKLFYKESLMTDLYVLAYPDEKSRAGGREWLISPRVVV